MDNWVTWVFGGAIYPVCRVLLLVYSGTLKLAGAPVVVIFEFLSCNALSVILINYRIYSPPLPLPKFLIALVQSAIAAITLATCVMVGRVRFLWLKCMVSVKRSLLVHFMRHLCVRQCSDNVTKYHPSTMWYSHVPLLSVFLCTCTDMPIGAGGILL